MTPSSVSNACKLAILDRFTEYVTKRILYMPKYKSDYSDISPTVCTSLGCI